MLVKRYTRKFLVPKRRVQIPTLLITELATKTRNSRTWSEGETKDNLASVVQYVHQKH